jgi:hypothetical protein
MYVGRGFAPSNIPLRLPRDISSPTHFLKSTELANRTLAGNPALFLGHQIFCTWQWLRSLIISELNDSFVMLSP